MDVNTQRWKVKDLAGKIDHTKLGPDISMQEIGVLCEQASVYGFANVCVPPCYVKDAKLILNGDSPKVGTVIGFPHGNHRSDTKITEASFAIEDGATEIDMVMSIGLLKSEQLKAVEEDIAGVVRMCTNIAMVKVILECSLLTEHEKRTACILARDAGADYVKTSTGFEHGGAEVHDIALMHETVGGDLGIKASGGIRTTSQALAMINAGATRIGASASISIIQGLIND